jgi:predicted RNase H-like HicB family nuclease
MYPQVPVTIDRQEDGLWRVEALHLNGCWVDAPALEQGLAEIQAVIAMVLDVYQVESWPLPNEVSITDDLPLHTAIPVAPGDIKFRRVSKPVALNEEAPCSGNILQPP